MPVSSLRLRPFSVAAIVLRVAALCISIPQVAHAQTVDELHWSLNACKNDMRRIDQTMLVPCKSAGTTAATCQRLHGNLDFLRAQRRNTVVSSALSAKQAQCRSLREEFWRCQGRRDNGSPSLSCDYQEQMAGQCQRELATLRARDPQGASEAAVQQAGELDRKIAEAEAAVSNCNRELDSANYCRELKGQFVSAQIACIEIDAKLKEALRAQQSTGGRPPPVRPGATANTVPTGRPATPVPSNQPPLPGSRGRAPDGSESGYALPTIPEGKLTNIWVYCDPKRIPLLKKATCKAYGGIQLGRPYPPEISSRVEWINMGPYDTPGTKIVTARVSWITGSDTVWVEDAGAPPPPTVPVPHPPPLRPPQPPRPPDTVTGPTKPASTDCWRRKPAKIETTYEKVWGGKQKNHSFTYSETSAALSVKTPENKSYSNTINWKAPPDTICKGQDVALSIQSTRSDGALITGDVRHNGAGPTPQVSSWNMLAASAQATVKFTTKPSIFAVAGSWVGTGFINDTEVRVRWEYE